MSATKEQCWNCKFYQDMTRRLDPLADTDQPWGFCRRYPPVQTDFEYDDYHSGVCTQPIVVSDDWCGEWKAREDVA